MEEKEIEKGIISEEALDNIAGGLKIAGIEIDKGTLIKSLKYAGVAIAGAGALAGTAAGFYKLGKVREYQEIKKEEKREKLSESNNKKFNVA